jgi:hypothetical protein
MVHGVGNRLALYEHHALAGNCAIYMRLILTIG